MTKVVEFIFSINFDNDSLVDKSCFF